MSGKSLGRVGFDWKVALVTIASTLLLVVDAYHTFLPLKAYDRLILYLVIPLAIIVFIFRETASAYGLAIGDWKVGVPLTLGAMLALTPALWVIARTDWMQAFYRPQLSGVPWLPFLDLLGWEFFFRGFILFAYLRRFGQDALWLQAVPFALAHIGKPEIETFSTIFGGFGFGWLAYRTRSFLYPFLLHWYIASATILFAAGVVPG